MHFARSPFPRGRIALKKRLDHPVVHYTVLAERSCKDCPIPDWKKAVSELASQLFQTLKLQRKLCDDVLKLIFTHVACLVWAISAYVPVYHRRGLLVANALYSCGLACLPC